MTIDGSHALAVRRLEGGRRPDGPGVRPLLRHAHRLLPRRLPDRARTTPGAMLHGFLSYLMRCTVTGEPYTVFGYGGKQVRDNIHSADLVRAFEAFHARAAARRRSTTSAAGATATARCSRRSTLCERDRRPRARLGAERRGAHGRPPLVDQRPAPRSRRDYPGLGARSTTCEAILREIHDQNVERWQRGVVKLSVVIPARNEAELDRRRRCSRSPTTLERERHRLRDHRGRRRAAPTAPARRSSSAIAAARPARCAACARPTATASGFAVRAGLEAFEGDAVAIVMADGSDDPRDLVLYYRAARGGLRLRVRLALHAGRGGHRLPAPQARDQPGRQLGHPRALPARLQRHDQRLQGVPARGDRERSSRCSRTTSTSPSSCRSRRSSAATATRSCPISWRNRAGGRSKLDLREMGSRYLFIVLYVVPRAPPEPRATTGAPASTRVRATGTPRCCNAEPGDRQTPTAGPTE